MKRFGAGVFITVLLLSLAPSCTQEKGGARTEAYSGQAPPVISGAGDGGFVAEEEAAVASLKGRADKAEEDLRRSASAWARERLAEARELLEAMEAGLEEMKASGADATDEFKAEMTRKKDEVELLLNQASSSMG